MAKLMPCSVCGEPRYVTAKSRAQIVCQECRRKQSKDRAPKDWSYKRVPCAACGEPCWPSSNGWAAKDGRSMCRQCRSGVDGTSSCRIVWRTCAHCSGPFYVKAERNPKRYCGRTCSNRARGFGDPKSQWAPKSQARRDREAAAPGLKRPARAKLLRKWQRQGRPCAYCPAPPTTVDHVVPLIRGGTNYEGNLVPACRACNSRKHFSLIVEWRHGARANRAAA